MNCFFCKGPAHPATGHAYNERVLACRNCFVRFFDWYRARMNHNPIALAARGMYEGLKIWKRKK